MKTKQEQFEVLIPNRDGTAVAEKVPVTITLEWDEEVKEWLVTPDSHQLIEDTKARHMGLLLPAQFVELRKRHGYSQKEMGELFQAGGKSWTRWESGKHRPSRMVNLLIRALYEGEISINYLLKRAGKPERQEAKKSFFDLLFQSLHENLSEEQKQQVGTFLGQPVPVMAAGTIIQKGIQFGYSIGQVPMPQGAGMVLTSSRLPKQKPSGIPPPVLEPAEQELVSFSMQSF